MDRLSAGRVNAEASRWRLSTRADPAAVAVADRHYNRQNVGSPQFVPPGRCLVLLTERALWVTSWPFAQYVRHRWPGAWVCSLFRNEGECLSSELIREAVAVTRWRWPDIPELGMITFVNRDMIRSTNPGYCYQQAGFVKDGHTKGGLYALRLAPEDMPDPLVPAGVLF